MPIAAGHWRGLNRQALVRETTVWLKILSKAKNTSIQGMVQDGILAQKPARCIWFALMN